MLKNFVRLEAEAIYNVLYAQLKTQKYVNLSFFKNILIKKKKFSGGIRNENRKVSRFSPP